MGYDNGVKELTAERQRHKEDCSNLAFREASKSSVLALLAAGSGVFAANTFSPAFRRALGTSGKAALVVRPAFIDLDFALGCGMGCGASARLILEPSKYEGLSAGRSSVIRDDFTRSPPADVNAEMLNSHLHGGSGNAPLRSHAETDLGGCEVQ